MALVDYSSSENDSDHDDSKSHEESQTTAPSDVKASSNLKRKRDSELPPLPSQFHDLYASTTRVSTKDDPSLHGGRKRITPHVEGNWPTHVYVEWIPSTSEYNLLASVIKPLANASLMQSDGSKVHSFLSSDLGVPLPLHISLSRPIGFSTDHKDEFVASLRSFLTATQIRPFDVSFSSLDWVANFEETRWFLVLRCQSGNRRALNDLLHVSNKVVEDYGQPPLYTKARQIGDIKPPATSLPIGYNQEYSTAFHVSIAWSLTVPSEKLEKLTKSLSTNDFDMIKNIKLEVTEIKAKVGNTVTSMRLFDVFHGPKNSGKSLFGV